MNKPEPDAETVGAHLRGYRVVTPSPELKERVLGAAREAWKHAPADDIPWTMPLLRFAACLVAAAIPVFWSHTADSSPVARPTVMKRESTVMREAADLWDMIGQPGFASLNRWTAPTPEPDAADVLFKHLRALSAELSDHRANGG